MYQKKVISKNENALFSLLLMFVKLVLLITFFWCIFSQLFQRIRNQREILRFFDTFSDFFKKYFFLGHLSTVLFSNFDCKCAGNGSKNQKTYLLNVSQISILHPSKGLYSLFSKKKSNSLVPTGQSTYFSQLKKSKNNQGRKMKMPL